MQSKMVGKGNTIEKLSGNNEKLIISKSNVIVNRELSFSSPPSTSCSPLTVDNVRSPELMTTIIKTEPSIVLSDTESNTDSKADG